MIKRLKIYKLSEKDEEDQELAEWVFQSHKWVETVPGYFACEWCKASITSTTPISKDFPLCRENPRIKSFKKSYFL